jgi:hypothetical protein
LQLAGGAVPDPHRARGAVSIQVCELFLVQLVGAVDAVHDLQRAGAVAWSGGQRERVAEGVERSRFGGESEPGERADREGEVAHPRVAVVPVALAADLLGQAGRSGGYDRALGPIGEELQRRRGAVDHLSPSAAVAELAEPLSPEPPGFVEQLLCLRLADRRHLFAALESERSRFARSELELCRDPGAGRAEPDGSGQRERVAGCLEHGATLLDGHGRLVAAVVKTRFCV